MQDNRALVAAPQKKTTKKQELNSASALIFKDLQALFAPASTPRASLLGNLIRALQVFGFFQIVARFFCLFFYNWQDKEDGVMGGHTRRSKHSSKNSSTVLCDSAASLEDWKQQIKVKGSIPATQQRLTFTSQRLFKQPIALANFSPNRQWQIIVDSSFEELCKDLRHWRAILHSKNSSAELLQPLVLKETDELASILHSRTAKELRDIGVPCNVFFLSFDKWIPTLQSGIQEEHTLPSRHPRVLDLKIDAEFCQNIFLIELCGDLNGLRLPMPLSYVMNGSELSTKLFMVEQTARYREEQQQRYHHFSASALKDSDAESSQGSVEVNCWNSHLKDYILEFDQNCEFTAFISKDNRRLRCIVLPVITISLAEARGSEEQSFLHLVRGDSNGEWTSSVQALASSSQQSRQESKATARNIVEELTPLEYSTRKNTKKKKKRKAKKAAKENVKLLMHIEEATTFKGATTELLQGEVATEDAVKHFDYGGCEKPCEATKTLIKGEVECAVGSDVEDEDIGGSRLIRDLKDLSLEEMEEEYNAATHSSLLCDHPVGSDQKQTTRGRLDIHNMGSDDSNSVLDHCDQVIDPSKVQGDFVGSKHCELANVDNTSVQTDTSVNRRTRTAKGDSSAAPSSDVVYAFLGQGKVDNASVQTDTSVNCRTSTAKGDSSAAPSSDVYDFLCQGNINSAQPILSKTADSKKVKQSFEKTHRAETRNVLHNADNITTSFNLPNERWEHTSSHTNPNRDSFWTHRASSGQEEEWRARTHTHHTHSIDTTLSYRSRTNHNSFYGDSKFSAPFWRHQRNDLQGTSSRPRLSRLDDWSADSSASRQFRNVPAWEQLPNLRQASTGTRFSNHWDNNSQLDESWSQGQSYSSFNMQQRKLGKSNKISQQYLDKRQFQGMSYDMAPLNMKALTGLPRISSVNPVQPIKAGSNGADHSVFSSVGLQSKGDVMTVPCVTAQTASATMASDQLPTESERSGLQQSRSQVVDHVCNILEGVNASSEALRVYEQNLNGKAFCEYEKVAKAVAPAFKASMSLQRWEHVGCSCTSLVSGFCNGKNARQVPDVPLSTLWQCYEEPSCYGLKVKLSAPSERAGNPLQAFFVPYLSGIQLFGWPERNKTDGRKDMMDGREDTMDGKKDTVAAHVGSSPFDSGFLSQPIFSVLLPRSETSNDHSSMHVQPGVRQKALDSDLGTISSSQRHCDCDDVELLYEFFEGEKPQQRKPLTDRIKELVSNDSDAHVLNTAKMEDLHPASWFAVAWYPIYKIPDETFRSTFLTYHCLSCLQSDCSESMNASHFTDKHMNTITAPVVGLMSYNAQVKDWFTLNPPCDVNLCDILQQYLAKLETAAASMARGGSCDDQLSSFKHADFRFFQSRGR